MGSCDISIILPSLNVAGYIEQCICSVINQTKRDIEIICVDAGSDDGTENIIMQYAAIDKRIRYIYSDKKSYGYQMNLGIKAANGKYVGIVETDDYVETKMFDSLYQIAVNLDVDFVKTGYTVFWDNGNNAIYYQMQPYDVKTILGKKIDLVKKKEYRLADINHIWSGIYRRDFLIDNELWFNETMGASYQDTSFSILVGLTAKNCVYAEGFSYFYRKNRVDASSNSKSKINCVIDEMTYVDRYLKNHNMDNAENKLMVKDVKLGVYKWNVLRLSDEFKYIFINKIKEEASAYLLGGEYYPYLTEIQRDQVKFITDCNYVIDYQLKEKTEGNYMRDIIEQGVGMGGYVVIGAGMYYEQFIEFQKVCDGKLIYAVCDNNRKLQHFKKCGYLVLSVEEASSMYQSKKWLILNKKNADEIENQLCLLGIDKNNITKMKVFPSFKTYVKYFF